MNVFVTGATGFIGWNVAAAFRRAGHEVWGLVRSKEKAKALLQNEIRPVVGDLKEPVSYKAVAESCSVLVHAAADYTGVLDKLTVETFAGTARSGARPKILVYTSGAWVYGDTAGATVDESAPLNPARVVAWRPANEELVLNATDLRGIVIRPGCVFGKQGSLTAMWFAGAYLQKSLSVIGTGDNHWAMIHVDDLARGYVLAAESGLSREVFNLADSTRVTVRDMTRSVARVAEYSGEIPRVPLEEALKQMGPLAEGLALDQHLDSGKAARLLGWYPRHRSFEAGISAYFEAWKSYQQ